MSKNSWPSGSNAESDTIRLTSKSRLPESRSAAARQHEVDAIVELLVAAIGAAVIVDHAESALVDILGGEEEAVVVRPHRALKLTEVARHIDEAAIAVGSRGAIVGRLGVDLVAPGQRRAPAIVVEGAGEVVDVGGAVALRAVVRVVEVQLGLVAAEAVVLRAVDRRVVVDALKDGLAVAALDQRWRQRSLHERAGPIGPDAVGVLGRESRMEPGVRHDPRP